MTTVMALHLADENAWIDVWGENKLCCRQRLQSAYTTDHNGVGMLKKGRESLDAKDVPIVKRRPK